MTIEQYYTAPPDEIFEDIKQGAMQIWNTYEDPYRTEKLERIKDLKNIRDNAWYMVAMFDNTNKRKLLGLVRNDTALMILDAMSE